MKKNQTWQGKVYPDVILKIVSVNEETNTVEAKILASNNGKDVGKVLSYRHDTFEEFYAQVNISGDTRDWAESTRDQVYAISNLWAKRYTIPQLRGFQAFYNSKLHDQTISHIEAQAFNNRWWCATWAIDIKAFGTK